MMRHNFMCGNVAWFQWSASRLCSYHECMYIVYGTVHVVIDIQIFWYLMLASWLVGQKTGSYFFKPSSVWCDCCSHAYELTLRWNDCFWGASLSWCWASYRARAQSLSCKFWYVCWAMSCPVCAFLLAGSLFREKLKRSVVATRRTGSFCGCPDRDRLNYQPTLRPPRSFLVVIILYRFTDQLRPVFVQNLWRIVQTQTHLHASRLTSL